MTLREKFEKWALDNDKPYDRVVPWVACELAFDAGYRKALEDAAQTVAITPLEVVPTFERDKDAANALTALLNSTQIGEKLADAIRVLRDRLD